MPLDPVAVLRECAFWLERARADQYRIRAYREAADIAEAIDPRDRPLTEAGWRQVPGFGPRTATVASAAMSGQLPDTLSRLRDEGRASLDPSGDTLRAALQGDLHTHTTWSDGGSPLAEMAAVAESLGHAYLAVTDHSPRLRVANGLSRDRLLAQWEEIERVQRLRSMRLLRGIEVDILKNGSLDQDDDLLGRLDIVVASVHSDLHADPASMTMRMIGAISNPHTTVLGHCTGRRVRADGTWREQSRFDAELVFAACAMFGVAVEINSRPERQDPPIELLKAAVEAGCLFSINSDAHAPGHLDFLAYGAARAAGAAIDPARIVTTWPVDRLLAHARRHR